MAEISLAAYQNRIADLAAEKRFDEVIAQTRHILKSYPKNLRAYQQLGGALFGLGRWEEATDVLRRVLGAQPQDFETHSLLAQSYQRLGQNDRAIWHAERALDQMPNDAATAALIRELYRQHRGEEILRLQMTAGALAQQHIRGNLLTEALGALDDALARNPERLDLQLLRARTLWLDGQRMDAAESAIEILERLPYAIDANRILTELWLAEQRPSDAQTYLTRIEELDPYLAHQLATGEPAPEDLLQLDEQEYSGIASNERAMVDPEWFNERGGEDSVLGALLGIDEGEAAGDERATSDLDDLLSDEQIDALFSELVTGESVAEVSEYKPADDDRRADQMSDDEASALAAVDAAADADELEAFMARMSASDEDVVDDDENLGISDELDKELASLLEQLDEESDDGDWMAEIQQGSLALGAEDDSLEYSEDFDREWVKTPDDDKAGAPWLSAAMREALDKDHDESLDLFSEDEQLQSLLERASDTEPIDVSDIEAWLGAQPDTDSSDVEALAADSEDDLLDSLPGPSWLEDADDPVAAAADDDDPNRVNAELIDSWQSELSEDDDDPYVDWLRDDPNELDDDLSIFAAGADEAESAAAVAPGDAGDAEEKARAWGLDDPGQLSDFVEEGADAGTGSSAWLNAVVPGLDRENDASTDDVNEYARPTAGAGKEFAWVSNIVEEETGEMRAVDPAEAGETMYFRFSKAPAWLVNMQAEAAGTAEGIEALGVNADIDSLELDDLTFDDYFSFDTPTDKMDVINLEDDTQELSFVGLDWDDYFDVESPTEKTIAITLDESAAGIDFEELGVDNDDFTFESDADQAPLPLLDAESDLFNDIGLEDEPAPKDSPIWLEYDNSPEDDSNRGGGPSTV